jgi:4-hydroxy-2-oxoglutarate aldolase
MNLDGIFPPITTPFDSSGALAADKLRHNIARYNPTGIAGYVVAGSTGESVLLSRNEIEELWEVAAGAAAPGMTLIAGTGVDSTAETISRTKRAAELGYHVALVKTPYYYKPQMNADVLAEHYLRVADAARIPLLIYSVPQFTGISVTAAQVARLAQHSNIIGIKESSGNVLLAGEIVAATPSEFKTLVGSAGTLFASVGAGAIGGILAVACFLPEACVELHRAARAGEMKRAQELQRTLLPAATVVVSKLGISGVKYAMDQVGYYGGPPRRPLLPLGEAPKKEVDAVLAGLAQAAAAK